MLDRHARRTRGALLAATLIASAACGGATAPTAAGADEGGGVATTPSNADGPITGTWTGENRWGPGPTEARRWTLTLAQSGRSFSGRMRTEQTSIAGTTADEGNISVNGTLAGSDVTFTMRAQWREAGTNTFTGRLSADGRTMRGVNHVPTVPPSILGDTITLVKQ
jgi:hypothetical protein